MLMYFVDAAYAVHDDFRSHTGGAMSIGYGVVCFMSPKQKISIGALNARQVFAPNESFPSRVKSLDI